MTFQSASPLENAIVRSNQFGIVLNRGCHQHAVDRIAVQVPKLDSLDRRDPSNIPRDQQRDEAQRHSHVFSLKRIAVGAHLPFRHS